MFSAPIDKQLHFLAGFGVAAMALPLGRAEAMAHRYGWRRKDVQP